MYKKYFIKYNTLLNYYTFLRKLFIYNIMNKQCEYVNKKINFSMRIRSTLKSLKNINYINTIWYLITNHLFLTKIRIMSTDMNIKYPQGMNTSAKVIIYVDIDMDTFICFSNCRLENEYYTILFIPYPLSSYFFYIK
jgi:hypothetical protein